MLAPISLTLASVAIAAFGLTMALYLRNFRAVVDLEYNNAQAQWERDGRPLGGRLTRKRASFWGSDLATIGCFVSWLGATPGWADEVPEAVILLRRTRQLFALHVVAGLVFFGVLFWYGYGW